MNIAQQCEQLRKCRSCSVWKQEIENNQEGDSMPRRKKQPKLTRAWKIRILQDEIDSSDLTLESWDIYNSASDQEEKEMVNAIKNDVELWMNELKGVSQPKLSMDDIDWKIHILDNNISAISQILKYEKPHFLR